MLAVGIVYAGLTITLAGAVSLIRPISAIGIQNRGRAAAFLVFGFLLVVIGWAMPAHEVHVIVERTQLDRFMPTYQFNEFHSMLIKAPKEVVYQAIKSVTAREIFLSRTLTWIRRFGRRGPESILNAPERQPLLDVATRTSFLLLAEEPVREIVVGTVVLAPRGRRPKSRSTPEDFKTFHDPGLH